MRQLRQANTAQRHSLRSNQHLHLAVLLALHVSPGASQLTHCLLFTAAHCLPLLLQWC
jgi:hypothetical protein